MHINELGTNMVPRQPTVPVTAENYSLFPLPDLDSDSDLGTDSCTMQILRERDPNLNLSQ